MGPNVTKIADKYNVSAAQVALKWISKKGHPLTFLSSNKEHQASDADLWSFDLEDDEMSTLDALYKPGQGEGESQAAIVVQFAWAAASASRLWTAPKTF